MYKGLTERPLFALSDGGTSRPADAVERGVRTRACGDIIGSDWQVHARPRDEGEFSFTKVELEVMSARHSEMSVAMWVLEDRRKGRNRWVSSA